MLLLPQTGLLKLLWSWPKKDRGLQVFPSMTKKTLFYGIFTIWIQEINPEHSGKFLSGSWVTFGLLTVKHLFCQRPPLLLPSPLSTSLPFIQMDATRHSPSSRWPCLISPTDGSYPAGQIPEIYLWIRQRRHGLNGCYLTADEKGAEFLGSGRHGARANQCTSLREHKASWDGSCVGCRPCCCCCCRTRGLKFKACRPAAKLFYTSGQD